MSAITTELARDDLGAGAVSARARRRAPFAQGEARRVLLLLLIAIPALALLLRAERIASLSVQHYDRPALAVLAVDGHGLPGGQLFYRGVALERLDYLGPAPPGLAEMEARLAALGYGSGTLRNGGEVPRFFSQRLPSGLDELDARRRKGLFLRLILPLVLTINEEIGVERARLLELEGRLRAGAAFSEEDGTWLKSQATRYRVKEKTPKAQIAALLRKVDRIPVSLALAQAAVESGWGSSRFAREGNALFGQRGGGRGNHMKAADDRSVRVRAYASLTESVRSYALNLNSHPSYESFRRARAAGRGQAASVRALIPHLEGYAEADGYADKLHGIIEANRLQEFELARLSPYGLQFDG